jgi:hypothetical protein
LFLNRENPKFSLNKSLLQRTNNLPEHSQVEIFNNSIVNTQTVSEDHASSIIFEEDTFKRLFSSAGRKALFAG